MVEVSKRYLFPGFLNFHIYLQQWAMLIDKRKIEEMLVFDYQKAIVLKSQLDREVGFFQEYVELFLSLLQPEFYSFENTQPGA